MTDLCFYDTEATDADKRHGQITQFGGIRTNLDFKILKKVNLRVRPLPWIVPTPEALRVTGMSIPDLFRPEALSEFEAAGEIERFLDPGWTGERIFVTYYGIDFDDELIRTTLFKNLRRPYVTSGKKSARVDMLEGVRLVHHFQPGTLQTVFDEERGKLTWRLEKICPANGIQLRAHDALADSEALMELTRLVRERAPWAWDVLVANGNAARVDEMLARAGEGDEPLFLFTHFGEPDVVPCFPVAADGRRKHILVDLRADSYPTDLETALGVFNKAGTPFPMIKSNLSPVFVPPEVASRIHAFDLTGLSEKIRRIKSDPGLLRVAGELAVRHDYKAKDNPTSEERIYDGFAKSEDKDGTRRFIETRSWIEKASISFSDDRLADFAARICLDACYTGTAALPASVVVELEDRAAEAISRPFAASDARWATIASVLEGDPPPEWVEWATDYYGMDSDWGEDSDADLDPDVQPSQPGAQQQLSLAF